MKNTYWTGYFPLVAILLFSSSLSISTSLYVMKILQTLGMYQGMLDYFSEKGIRLALFATVRPCVFYALFGFEADCKHSDRAVSFVFHK